MAKKKRKKRQEEALLPNVKAWVIFYTIIIVALFVFIYVVVILGDAQKAKFDDTLKDFCKLHGWELSGSYYFSGGECRELRDEYVTYHRLEIINKTIYLVMEDKYTIILNYFAANNSGVIDRCNQDKSKLLIPDMPETFSLKGGI